MFALLRTSLFSDKEVFFLEALIFRGHLFAVPEQWHDTFLTPIIDYFRLMSLPFKLIYSLRTGPLIKDCWLFISYNWWIEGWFVAGVSSHAGVSASANLYTIDCGLCRASLENLLGQPAACIAKIVF
jgi:hypothetical protein